MAVGLFSEDLRHEALELLAWALTEGNRFFHLLYSVGVWLPVDLAREASACGWNAVESCSHLPVASWRFLANYQSS